MNIRATSSFKIGQPIGMQNRHNNDKGELKITSIAMPRPLLLRSHVSWSLFQTN